MAQSPATSPIPLTATLASSAPDVAIERAWRTLSLVNEWTRFLDGKATAILAADAAITGAMLSFIKGQSDLNKDVPVCLCLLAVAVFLVASIFKGLYCIAPTLYPRKAPLDTMFFFWEKPFETEDPDKKNSVIYFEHIASSGDADTYIDKSHRVYHSEEETYRQIAQQIHANSTVATHKSEDVGRAIQFLVWAILFGILASFFIVVDSK